jgi:hypothetical protein
MRLSGVVALLPIALVSVAGAQQVPDTSFRPPIEKPAYAAGQGPVVLVDEAHVNFHTAGGRYAPFADLLRRDGYVVKPSTARFTSEALQHARVIVIANAVHESNRTNWAPPNPSAFTSAEIAALREWIAGGGALLLIADHAPFAGAAADLGKALGVRFLDGYVGRKGVPGPMVFRRSEGSLRDHPVTAGVSEVATFTGSSFQLDAPGDPVLVFGADTFSSRPNDKTEPVPVAGRLQGALLTIGKGKVAVFGEAAMFSAQLGGPDKRPIGMNAPVAKENPRFLLNVMHWLTGASF